MNRRSNQQPPNPEEVRWSVWRSRFGRRALVTGVVLGVVVQLISVLPDIQWLRLAGLLFFIACSIAIHIVTRQVADMPPDRIDERQRKIQKEAYLSAYRIVGALVAVITLALMFTRAERIPVRWASEGAGILLFLVLALPSCVLAWREREV